MSTCLRMSAVLLGALAVCGCASPASAPSRLTAQSKCMDRAADSHALANNPCTTPGERAYSQSDLQRTGKTTVSEALPLLDPALAIRR